VFVSKYGSRGVLKRPSQHCKSPYVADVLLDSGEEVIVHAPSLGCCGLCDKGSIVYMTLSEQPKKCTHIIHLGQQNNVIVGIHPKSGEKIVEYALKNNRIDTLKHLNQLQRKENAKFKV